MSKCAAFVCGVLTALVVSVLVVQVILARFGKLPNPMPPVVVDADGKFYVCCMALGIENKVEMCVYPPPSSPSQAGMKSAELGSRRAGLDPTRTEQDPTRAEQG
jgi:hypothetical protein